MADAEPTVWAIIPARGGSKGIPGKNLKAIQGRSLIARAVRAACNARRVTKVIVSTDDGSIASEARSAGAQVVDRPASIADDFARSEDALLHVLNAAEHDGETLPDLLAFIQCTSPFVSSADIDGTIERLVAASADTALTVAATHQFLWRRNPDGSADGVNHQKSVRKRRQDREPSFVETGAVYVMRTSGFRVSQHRFFGKTVFFETPSSRAMEIDAPDDLASARLLASIIDPALQASAIPDPLGAVIFDFDGVMTDNRVIVSEGRLESVICDRGDGFGIEQLRNKNIPVAVISREGNPVVAARCEKLGLMCIQSSQDKAAALRTLCRDLSIELSSTVYVGNDIPDIPCLELSGLGVVVADAHPLAMVAADLVLTQKGGAGAVRELCDIIIEALRR